MFVLTILIIATLMFYLRSRFVGENEEVLSAIAYTIGISTALCFLLLFFQDESLEINLFYLLFVPFFLYGIYYIQEKTKGRSLAIIANQQRYFQEVDSKKIYSFYRTRKSIKSNRVETLINKESKMIIKNGVIIPSFFLDLATFQLTLIKSVKDLGESAVFSAIFSKIQDFAQAREMQFDYEKELENNAFYAEFFLLDLYEKLTSPFNIGVANLEVIATNRNEIELLGALDLVNLNSVKRKGAVLYYKYIEFKSRIDDFVAQYENISPSDEGFDESYIKN